MSKLKKLLYIFAGSIAFGLGVLGVFVPGLPTTPFILLASWLYIRSSKRLYVWLLASPMGKYVKGYHDNGGMGKKAKISAILTMWFMISLSCIFFIPIAKIKLIVCLAGVVGTSCVLFVVPSARQSKKSKHIN
ncbi:MAG: YbaN family protein [Bacteroidetes bacterium]|nr:YbaN family protein [Bacteroidota bacterium]